MNLIKPKNLKKGDTIGILATSGDLKTNEEVKRAKLFFENKGYKVVLSENLFDKKRYLAGEDDKKIEELHKFFLDNSINAIICARGGYGAIRLINKINYSIIKNNPKIFAGYSDITALSAMFLKKAKLITYSAPMITSDFGQETLSEFTLNSFFNVVEKDEKQTLTAQNVYREGKTSGITFGGNLATIVSLCGIDFIPDEKFIFFAEDLCEPVYKIDKMFTQLMNIEKFRNNISGIVLGEFLDNQNEEWLEDLFKEIANNLKVPMIGGLKITHAKDKLTISYGTTATINNNIFEV